MASTAATPSQLIALREGGSLPPLFLVHGAGDDLAKFRELARLLGADQPCFSFHLAGGQTWRAMERVERLATHYRRSMEPKIVGRPFFLAGYSFGGTVAYEMAVQLAAAGEPPLALVLLDTLPPSVLRMALGFKNREGVSWVTRARRIFLRGLVAAGGPLPKRWATVYPVEAATRAVRGYELPPYLGKVILIRSTGRGRRPRSLRWSEILGENLEVILAPGGHLEMFDSLNIEVVAERLGQALRLFAERQGNGGRAGPGLR
jgi:aspartate racemase